MRTALISIIVCLVVVYVVSPWEQSPQPVDPIETVIIAEAPPPKVITTLPLAPIVAPIAALLNAVPKVAALDPLNLPGQASPQIQMSWCASAGCEITFVFTVPVKDAHVTFAPEQAGKQTWRS